jgi:hypothetical protein
LNYELLIVVGVFPAVMMVGFVLLALMCFPYIAYTLYQMNREQVHRENQTRELIQSMFRAPWNKQVFTNQ